MDRLSPYGLYQADLFVNLWARDSLGPAVDLDPPCGSNMGSPG